VFPIHRAHLLSKVAPFSYLPSTTALPIFLLKNTIGPSDFQAKNLLQAFAGREHWEPESRGI
jgi:hypothetical protein